MGPKPSQPQSGELFGYPLLEHLNTAHPLIKLAGLLDWQAIESAARGTFTSNKGRAATSPRLIAGLLYLQHAFDLSDEQVVMGWVENPYWQVFTGEQYLQTRPPIDPSSLTRWRHRLGEAGIEELLAQSIGAAKGAGVIKESSVQRVIVDTTVMPKAVAHPTDSRLLERAREQLVKAADAHGLKLRQNYNRIGPKLALQIGRYAHAKQFKRMNKALRTLRSRVGRVHRDIGRQLEQVGASGRDKLIDLLALTKRVLEQKRKDKNKLYALHAPEVECIGKGKARTPYEFGVKVSIATTLKEGLVVGARSMPGNPYDGHTLGEALEQVEILSNVKPAMVFVDRGYRAAWLPDTQVFMSGQRRGITPRIKLMIKRRSAIEPTIGHMKSDGRLGRNPLKGALGDAIHAILCGAGHNIRMILRKLRLLLRQILLAWLRSFYSFANGFALLVQ